MNDAEAELQPVLSGREMLICDIFSFVQAD